MAVDRTIGWLTFVNDEKYFADVTGVELYKATNEFVRMQRYRNSTTPTNQYVSVNLKYLVSYELFKFDGKTAKSI